MDPKDIIPRFVKCEEHDPDGNIKQYTWDKDKITVEAYLLDDLLMLQNVFEGKIISPSVYPLIYETKSANKEISVRSLEFYREVAQDSSLYETLSKEDKAYFLIGLRDLLVASCRHLLSQEEQDLLVKITNLVDSNDDDKDIVCKRINDIDVTPYPTCRNKLVRFVDEKSESIKDEYFIRNELNLLICFADPQDLSYHNFENIINLDSVFETYHQFSISNIQKEPNADVYTFDMTAATKILSALNEYNLYVEPLNKLSRGGQRFIFSSEKLSTALTTSIISADFNREHLITDRFRFVNYVFRYNKFRPTDKKFSSHFDTPYYDPVKKHYSKYTVIFYLTSGQADPVLSINKGKVKIDKIDVTGGKIKGVIFDQRYEHEGKSFIEGDKIFLRSELVFEYGEEDGFRFDEEASKKFNIGCYMTKQSLFNREVEKYASDCFNHAAEARIKMSRAKILKDILLCKEYEKTAFVTNGYDYWFTKDISLEEAAIMALLDYFNCKFESGQTFNKLTYHRIVDVKSPSQIFAYLTDIYKDWNISKEECKQVQQEDEEEEEKAEEAEEGEEEKEEDKEDDGENKIDNSEEECKEEEAEENKTDNSDNESVDSSCCPVHTKTKDKIFNPKKNQTIRDELEHFQEYSTERLRSFRKKFTISVFDQQVEINKSKIKITENEIIFDSQVPTINFAACWSSEMYPSSYLSVETHTARGYTNIPPIQYQTSEEGYHLKIELFHNGFVRKHENRIKKFHIEKEKVREDDYHPGWSDSSLNDEQEEDPEIHFKEDELENLDIQGDQGNDDL